MSAPNFKGVLVLGIFNTILFLFSGAGAFLVGIVMFSKSIQKNASKGMRALFDKISDNRLAGVGVGAAAAGIMQSSTATTVMCVGLVNAGILTLFQASAIAMGSHIGATATGYLVALGAFPVKYFFMVMAFVGALMKIISKSDKAAKIADILISFGIVFIGLEIMSMSLRREAAVTDFISNLFVVVNFPLLLILIAMVVTVILNSSGATTAIFIALMAEGLLGFDEAMFLVIGANIGTAFTAIFASITAGPNAKRTAIINLLCPVLGAIIFTSFLWPLRRVIAAGFETLPSSLQIPIFNTAFNVGTTLILIWFIKPLVLLSCKIIKSKPEDDIMLKTSYIDERLLATPAIAIGQIKKEIVDMAKHTRANLVLAFDAIMAQNLANTEKIEKTEELINFLDKAITRFIIKLSASSVSPHDDIVLGSSHHAISDIERIGDYAKKMLTEAERMKRHKYQFTKKGAANALQTMFNKVLEMYDLSQEIFETNDQAKLTQLKEMDVIIDSIKSKLADAHVRWLKAGEWASLGGDHFYSLVCDLERIADHIVNFASTIIELKDDEAEKTTLDFFGGLSDD
jgi:phosphate:Na+ symporter